MPALSQDALLVLAIGANVVLGLAIVLFAWRTRGEPSQSDRAGTERDLLAGSGASTAGPLVLQRVAADDSGQRPGRQAGADAVRPDEGELRAVLAGTTRSAAYVRAIRIVSWAFILSTTAIVAASGLWRPNQQAIFLILVAAGVFLLVVHDLIPRRFLGSARFVFEGIAAIALVSALVLLTGRADSPFVFVYPLVVGGMALVVAPAVTVGLAALGGLAYVASVFLDPYGPLPSAESVAAAGVNLAALCLLAYGGIVIAREQHRTREAAIRLSTVDSLTGLYNRGYFFTIVDREIERSSRFRRGFCLLMMDLDELKWINDRFGHYHGDRALRGVAGVIGGCLRKVDTAARYGGDEFVALLPETDPTGAFVVAEKIRQGAAELVIDAGGTLLRTSISVGVVTYPEDGSTADELMIAADEAMYRSKRLGKNRVVGFVAPDDRDSDDESGQGRGGPPVAGGMSSRSSRGRQVMDKPEHEQRDVAPAIGRRDVAAVVRMQRSPVGDSM